MEPRNINIIIFSKDRAAQLELFIRSMKEFFKEFNDHQIKILYKSSNYEFEKGYRKVISIHNDSNIQWRQEVQDFQKSLTSIIDFKDKYSVFFVDDNVFKEPFSLEDKQFKIFSERKDILTLSLRLHPRLNYCYPARLKQVSPPMDKDGVFNWFGKPGDFGYALSLDGHIFETRNIKYYFLNLRYNGPNDLESQMAMHPIPIPNMICYDKSKIMNLPLNKVQNYNNNVHGNVTAEFLNQKFLEGKRISLNNIRGFENYSCHQEIDIELE